MSAALDFFAAGADRLVYSEALVAANYRKAEVRPQRRPAPDLPLFAAE
ncbi:hypothetical protein [Methylobacterium tarhaniae]|nr:hypothetical protein [Methylobacterium tarhaniae]